MRKLIVSEFVTLDGVMEAPDMWSFDFQNDKTGEFKKDELFESDALLVGKATYDIFAGSWPSRTGDFANLMNSIPKYVVTTHDAELTWNNSHAIKENIVSEIAKLKEQPGKDILVAGSSVLVKTLLENDLIDELRLFVCPIVLGKGVRLFNDNDTAKFTFVSARPFNTGAVVVTYSPVKK
ncbi:MAG: bifunctional deaminase-reductase domain protein [Candidatus Saccharibacteria bacterium]|nr:bifunctional deaminase-reductase domain protein [Candidatus Saccharibacteria bacterium]